MPMKSSYAPPASPRVRYDREELKERLDPVQFQVTQEGGTERPHTNKYYKHYETGSYTCVVCGERIFSSETKYNSGSGWPSFYDLIDRELVTTRADTSGVGGNLLRIVANPGLIRTEVLCRNCGSHLGHVFKDGPQPTGLRYCVNSSSLNFISAEDDDDDEEEGEEEVEKVDGGEPDQSKDDENEVEEVSQSNSEDVSGSKSSNDSARKKFFSSMMPTSPKKKTKKKGAEILSFPATLGGCGPDGVCQMRRKAVTPMRSTAGVKEAMEKGGSREQSV